MEITLGWPARWYIIWISRRTSSTSSSVTSFRLRMDLQANSLPVLRSTHRYVVPNCPCPSFRPRLYLSLRFSVFRFSTEPTSSPALETRFTGGTLGRGLAASPPESELAALALEVSCSASGLVGLATAAAESVLETILTGSGALLWTATGASAVGGSRPRPPPPPAGPLASGSAPPSCRAFHSTVETDWKKPFLLMLGPTHVFPIAAGPTPRRRLRLDPRNRQTALTPRPRITPRMSLPEESDASNRRSPLARRSRGPNQDR
uniref:Uncharacterized protein n=1 Tax=Oryza brachyantha TaxID=4533 RepID=J3LTJ2_ORYBR